MADEERQGDAGSARLTPYELAFLDGDFESRVFPAIDEEARARSEDVSRRERFSFLAAAGEAVRDIVPPDAPPEMLDEYRSLFYHAFNFWRHGRRTYVVDRAVARYLVESSPRLADWTFRMPAEGLYLQLPPNLFWASIDPELPPEPVDGFFCTLARGVDPLGMAYQELQALMVLGIHRNRPGFSVIPFETEIGAGIPAAWTEAGRDEGGDFANVLPGGEMAGLYSVLTTTEALKLVALCLWFIDRNPEGVAPEPPPERRTEDRPGSVPLSRMDFLRVRLAGPAQ